MHHQSGLAEVDQLTQRCYAPLCSGGSFLSSCSSASVCKIIQLRGLRCENALPCPRFWNAALFEIPTDCKVVRVTNGSQAGHRPAPRTQSNKQTEI